VGDLVKTEYNPRPSSIIRNRKASTISQPRPPPPPPPPPPGKSWCHRGDNKDDDDNTNNPITTTPRDNNILPGGTYPSAYSHPCKHCTTEPPSVLITTSKVFSAMLSPTSPFSEPQRFNNCPHSSRDPFVLRLHDDHPVALWILLKALHNHPFVPRLLSSKQLVMMAVVVDK